MSNATATLAPAFAALLDREVTNANDTALTLIPVDIAKLTFELVNLSIKTTGIGDTAEMATYSASGLPKMAVTVIAKHADGLKALTITVGLPETFSARFATGEIQFSAESKVDLVGFCVRTYEMAQNGKGDGQATMRKGYSFAAEDVVLSTTGRKSTKGSNTAQTYPQPAAAEGATA